MHGHYTAAMAAEELVVHGAPRAQPEERLGDAAAERADLHHRALGIRQVLARVRHDLRRGATPLRRVALVLRAPVPPDDGEARRRLDRRPLAGHLDRSEDNIAQPTLDRWDRHRDLRLLAAALRAGRQTALPCLRQRERRAVGSDDRRPDPAARRRDEVHGQRPGGARSQGRVQRSTRFSAGPTVSAVSSSTESSGFSTKRSSSTRSSSTRSRS